MFPISHSLFSFVVPSSITCCLFSVLCLIAEEINFNHELLFVGFFLITICLLSFFSAWDFLQLSVNMTHTHLTYCLTFFLQTENDWGQKCVCAVNICCLLVALLCHCLSLAGDSHCWVLCHQWSTIKHGLTFSQSFPT